MLCGGGEVESVFLTQHQRKALRRTLVDAHGFGLLAQLLWLETGQFPGAGFT